MENGLTDAFNQKRAQQENYSFFIICAKLHCFLDENEDILVDREKKELMGDTLDEKQKARLKLWKAVGSPVSTLNCTNWYSFSGKGK